MHGAVDYRSFVGRSLLAPNIDPHPTQGATNTQGQNASTHNVTGVPRIHRSFSQTPKSTRRNEEFRSNRTRKTMSLVSTGDVFGKSSLLSEITKSLKVSNLLSYDSIESAAPTSKSFAQVEKDESSLNDEVFLHDNVPLNIPAAEPSVGSEKSVSFLWRVLGRATPNSQANIYVVSIQAISKVGKEGIEVRKGQQLKALYRESDKVFVQAPCLEEGFVPYSMCRLSRKHYGSQSKLIQLSYLRLYPQSPDGIDILPTDHIPRIRMTAVRSHIPSTHEELSVESDQSLTILYCDTEWVYANSGRFSGLLPRFTCNLIPSSKRHFEKWDQRIQPFQSDFIMRYDEPRPQVLEESPVPITAVQRTGSKVGKMFTVIQNFVPVAPTSGAFTIRKGLRVRVVEESVKQVRVTTKMGTSFWIPQNHVRPARKGSVADKFAPTQHDYQQP
jgi:hypothetical protein